MSNGEQTQFNPQITPEQTRHYIGLYDKNPGMFPPEQLELIRQHAQYHNIPFYEGDFGIVDAVKQFAGGFIEGFTTFNVLDEAPDNEYEAIIRSIGHLAGFAPGFAAAPIRGLGVLTKSSGMIRKAAALGKLKSVPLLGADFLTKRFKSIASPILKNMPNSRFKAMSVASKFLLGNKAKHVMEGAFHLGAASSISSVWHGVDEMMNSFFGGAIAGGAFAGMGNLINMKNPKAEIFARGLAGSLFQGLHSTARGATTPEQIYEYLLGAYFGGSAKPWYIVKASKNIQKMDKEAKTNPQMDIERDPELLEGFEEQPELVQKHTKKIAKEAFGDPIDNAATAYMMMERLGITDKIPEDKITTSGYETLSKLRKQSSKSDSKAKIISIGLGSGEKGISETFAKELEKAGVPVINYLPTKPKKGSKSGEDIILTEKELYEHQEALNIANKTLRHNLKKIDDKTLKVMLRSILQTDRGDSVFIIGEIERSNKDKRLNGSTVKDKNVKWGVQSGIDKKKPTYIFDTKSKVWHKFNYDPKIRRFEPIKEIPTLSRKPVILAGGKPSVDSRKAIKDIVKQSMGEPVKQTPPKKGEKRTSIEDMPERHPETWNQLWDLTKKKRELSDKLEKAEKPAEIDKLTKEYDDLVAEENLLMELRPVEYIDTETGVLVNDIDTGGKLDISVLMKKSEYFVRTHLPHLWVKEDKPRESLLKSAKIVEDIVSKYEKPGETEIKSEEAVKEIEKQLNTTLEDNSKGEIRRWIRELNLSKPVTFIRVDANGKVTLTDPNRPRAMSGKNKLQKEPVKEIETIYEEEGGEYKKGAKSAYIILDEVSIRDDRGIMIDIPIDRLAKYIQFNVKTKGKRTSKDDSELKARAIIKRVIKTMDKEHNMYPIGGVGDKSRIIFTKVHPKSRGSNIQILRDLVKIRRELRKIDPNHTEMFKQAKKDAFRRYGIDEKTFNKLFHSNVMYDLSLNGYDLTKLNKLMGEGFIGNPIAYNKRAQIWMTPSLAADRVFLTDHISDLKSSKDADYYGSTNEDFKRGNESLTQDDNSYYRGFYGDPVIDKNGNLILRSRRDDMFERNFPNKGRGTSVTGDSRQAREYALTRYNEQAKTLERIRHDRDYEEVSEWMLDRPSTVVKIDKKAFNNATKGKEILKGQEASVEGREPEQRVVSKEDIIIPKDKWKSYKMNIPEITGETTPLSENIFARDKLVYSLIGDPSKPKGKTSLKALNIELPEHVDGAILVRDDIVDALNKDAGHPMSGQNKSFIIDKHGELGTMLGKYMIHKVGPEGTQQMKDKGVHMLIMTSAAKQTGLREIGDYNVSDKGFELKAPKYTMDPESIKYSGSTIQTPHMMKNQVWVKQLFTNLHQFGYKAIDKSIIEDIQSEIIDKSFNGTNRANTLLADYLTDFNQKKIPELLNSLEEIGSMELLSALKTPGAERFAEGALQRMLKVVEENVESDYQSGYITLAEKDAMVNDLFDTISPVDRLVKNAAIVGEEASAQGKVGFSAYHHKHIRDYKNAVLHNYFVKSVTKPKVSNSMVARMRPYDKWMQRNEITKDLNTRDDIFYLDGAYRAVKIKTSFKEEHLKDTTLGVLWDMYSNNKFSGQRKKEVEEIFEAVVLRVPMDSMSGAHKLKFEGFTGVDGHGIMMHSRSMRALGGADLDGDEAFVYFGGRSPDGKGGGMKQSWKEAIHAQKEEFYKGKGTKRDVGDNKRELMNHPGGLYKGKTFADVLTISAEGDNPMKTSKTLYYAPSARLQASEGAIDGRNRLGPAVNNGQIMKSVYNSLMDTPGKKDIFEIDFYNKKKKKTERLIVEITPREGSEWNQYQREMTRAQIAFASDPLDEAGLVESSKFFTLLHDAYFKTRVLNSKGKEIVQKMTDYDPLSKANLQTDLMGKPHVYDHNLSAFHLKNGLIGKFINMNSAFFGRNWEANRRYTPEEVSELSSGVLDLLPQQLNTILPHMIRKLHGLDWSDNIIKRIDVKRVEDLYFEMEDISEKFTWLQDIMGRKSFRVPYNKYVENVIEYDLQDIRVRERHAYDNALFAKAIKGTVWEKIVKGPKGEEYLTNIDKKFEVLTHLTKQAEDFILNDFTDMATLLNMQRVLGEHKINGKRIGSIFRQAELFKARSYLNSRERNMLDLEVYEGTPQEKLAKEATEIGWRYYEYLQGKVKTFEKDLGKKGEERSTTLDQAMIDEKIQSYRANLKSVGEKDLFDQFMIGSLNRGNLAELQKIIDKIPAKKWNPIMADLINKLVKEGSRTSLSRLAINSESIPDASIRNHLRALTDVMGKSWERPNDKDIESSINKTSGAADKSMSELADGTKTNQKEFETKEMEELVNDVLGSQTGYIGIKKGEVKQSDKDLIVELTDRLSKYNNKLGNNLNEVLRGLMETATGRAKDLNAFNRQDFQIINNLLAEYESGTMFQRLFRDSSPDIKKRYYMLFPETIAREQMKYDILWLKKEGYYVDKSGKPKTGTIIKPTHYIEVLNNWITKTNGLATAEAEKLIVENGEVFLNLNSFEDGASLFKIANAQREGKYASIIENDKTRPFSTRKNDAATYRINQRETEKELKWDKLKDKEFTLTNDEGQKVNATGLEIIEGSKAKQLTGIKDKITKQFKKFYPLINGTIRPEDSKYFAGDWFDGNLQTQPRMNWKKFIADMEAAYNKGEKPPMELGIDGMRFIARSMMVDLAPKESKKGLMEFIIAKTGHIDPEVYFPHMFFSKKDAEKSLRRAIKSIKEDPNLSDKIDKKTGMSERQRELNNIAFRHKTLTGDWEFQDMQDWDRVDQLDYRATLESIAKKKKEKKEHIQWVESNKKMGSMFSRKGHIPGWANDLTVMNAYIKNLTSAYYRQVNQIMSRNVMNEAWKGQSTKFGPEVAARWQNWYKLYVQGAMGNPDVIPEAIMNDPGMKLKGTPFAWWSDNNVLKRVNGIKEKLGLGKKDLPKELTEFDYNDIRKWSNLEAKFELASLLAHPKSAVNNIFGGSMHTIESVGFSAWRKARNITYLRNINPEWKTKDDVMRFVIEKGVLPEFLVHELGLGPKVNRTKVSSFVGELTNTLIGNKEIAKKDITALGKKHGITDAIIDKAAMFMTVPERALRRDAFMAHYIRAWESFGGAIKDHNHPFLIEQGLKGVKATQFLYDAPNRPMFARTALGKIMTRFQLWSWNSVRFRNDVTREARIHGYKPGTEAFDRFKRTMQIDLFVLALANMFVYSLFEQALPAPWNWFQDTADWLFGDEKERDKAFFGNLPGAIAPLQIIMPPISRFPITGLSQWIRNDYDKFTDYTMYTLLPFGRIVRDIVHPEKGLINNPLMIMEKTTGLPLLKVAQLASKKGE